MIMAYKPEESSCEATNERLEQFSFFLDKEEYNKFFVWVDFESGELQMDFYSAPKFYERDVEVKREDFQVVYFIKRVPSEKVLPETITS
jgi:hypothetical protein